MAKHLESAVATPTNAPLNGGRLKTAARFEVDPSPDDRLSPDEAAAVRLGEAQLRRGASKSWRAVKDDLAR